MNLIRSLCLLGADVLGLFSHPEHLCWKPAKPLFGSSPTPWKKQMKGLGISGRWVGKGALSQTNEHEQCLPGLGPEHQERPSQGGVLCFWLVAKSLAGGSRSNGGQGPGGWTRCPGALRPQSAARQWLLAKRKRSEVAWPGQLGIDEGHGNVAGAPGGGEPLVVVRESPGVHEGPALPWGSDGAVVAQEPTTSALGDRKRQFSPMGKLGPAPTSLVPLTPPPNLSHCSPGVLRPATAA